MNIRQYKWDDLELMCKFFKITVKDLMTELHGSSPTYYAAMNELYSEGTSAHWRQTVGMYLEIFAIYYAQSFRYTQQMDPHDCYECLLDYIRYVNDSKDHAMDRFDYWYMAFGEDILE